MSPEFDFWDDNDEERDHIAKVMSNGHSKCIFISSNGDGREMLCTHPTRKGMPCCVDDEGCDLIRVKNRMLTS